MGWRWCLWYNNGIKKELGYFEKGEKRVPGHYGLKMDKRKVKQTLRIIKYMDLILNGMKKGKLIKNIIYAKGEPVSEYLVVYQDSGYIETNKYKGKLSGSYISWYSNGKKKEEGSYKDGKKNGNWDGWYPNGEKKYSAKFVNGGATGLYTELDKNGRVLNSIEYENGNIIGEFHVLRDNSGIIEYHKIKGVMDGLWTRWYLNGQKAEEGFYKNGEKSGNGSAGFQIKEKI